MIEQARDFYLGKSGEGSFNCGQAVLKAFQRKYAVPETVIEMFKDYGRGNAPEGMCGAFYAGRCICDKHCPGQSQRFEQAFIEAAGSRLCRDIREQRKLTCVGCVEKAAELLAQTDVPQGAKEG